MKTNLVSFSQNTQRRGCKLRFYSCKIILFYLSVKSCANVKPQELCLNLKVIIYHFRPVLMNWWTDTGHQWKPRACIGSPLSTFHQLWQLCSNTDCQKVQDLLSSFLLTNGWHFYSSQRPILLDWFKSFLWQIILFNAVDRMNTTIWVGIFFHDHNMLINFLIFHLTVRRQQRGFWQIILLKDKIKVWYHNWSKVMMHFFLGSYLKRSSFPILKIPT